MQIWVEKTPHADGSYTWALNYKMSAADQKALDWQPASELYNITFTLKYSPTSGGLVTRSGNLSKDHRNYTDGVLWDGTDRGAFINIVSISVTGQRYGGSNGITVSYQH
jgi:hypothetical protein